MNSLQELITKCINAKTYAEQAEIYEIIKDIPNPIQSESIQSFLQSFPVSDILVQIASRFQITLDQKLFGSFWDQFISKGVDIEDDNPCHNFYVLAYFFSIFPEDSYSKRNDIIEICFNRINKVVSQFFSVEIYKAVITLLASLASISPMSYFLEDGVFESIFITFLNHDETFDQALLFLSKLFQRPDIDSYIDHFIYVLIVVLPNFSPPKPQLWRFICWFLGRFGAEIEEMITFDNLDENGQFPIFIRSLFWCYRQIYQNPPENVNEPDYWNLFNSLLSRYDKALQEQKLKHPNEAIFQIMFENSFDASDDTKFYKEWPNVLKLVTPMIPDIRLSIFWSLKSSLLSDGSFYSHVPLQVLDLIRHIDSQGLLNFSKMQLINEALYVTISNLIILIEDQERIIYINILKDALDNFMKDDTKITIGEARGIIYAIAHVKELKDETEAFSKAKKFLETIPQNSSFLEAQMKLFSL